MNLIYDPWPWYISGPLIALVMFLLLMVGKSFGMSSNLRTLCTICGAGNTSDFFKFDWKAQKWNLVVVFGAIIGGFIGAHFLSNDLAVAIHPDTIETLNTLGFESAHGCYGTSTRLLKTIHHHAFLAIDKRHKYNHWNEDCGY